MTDRECSGSGTQAPAGHTASRWRFWIVAVLAVMLIVVHGLVLHYASSHLHLTIGLASGLAVLIFVKHFGLFRPVYAKFRNRTRKRTSKTAS